MLLLTQLVGFGSGSGGGTDATPDAIDFNNISDVSFDPYAATNTVTISGIDTTITLRLTLSSGANGLRGVDVYRNSGYVGSLTSGTTFDVSLTNGQTLYYGFYNSQDNTTWSGTATVSNLSDGGATLDTFTYTLQDTGNEVGVDAVVLF
jgi:hypothetical protein